MTKGKERDLKAVWEVTEELWGVEGGMIWQRWRFHLDMRSHLVSSRLFSSRSRLDLVSSLLDLVSSRLISSYLLSFLQIMIKDNRWRSGKAEQGWRHLQEVVNSKEGEVGIFF